MREKGIFLLKAAGCIVVSIIAGCMLMSAVYALPTDRIRRNIGETAEMIENEGVYYQWAQGYKNAQADNYTDASLYLNAMYPGSGNVVRDAMNNPRRLYGDDNNEASVLLMAEDRAVDSKTHDVNYGRYWHGSLILLKPLLQFFDLADIRMFNMIVHTGMLFLIITGFARCNLLKALPGFFAAIILINPITMIMCFCFSVEYTIMLAGTALMLYFHDLWEKKQNCCFFFLWLGILTVYFNELSFPMLTFGIPMVTYLLLSREKGWRLVKKEIQMGLCWGVGYVFVWMGKWLCAWMFTGYNYFAEAVGQAQRYTSNHATWENVDPALVERLWKNLKVYLKWPFVFLVVVVLIMIMLIIWTTGWTVNRECLEKMLPFLLMALFPIGVFIALGNGYSYVHYWFSHRLLSISAFAGISMLLQAAKKHPYGG